MMYCFAAFAVCLILSTHDIESKIVVNEPSNALMDYIKYVYNFYSKKHNGYNTVVINSDDNALIDNSVQHFNTHSISTNFLLNLNAKDVEYQIDQIEHQNLYLGFITIMTIFIEVTTDLIPTLVYLPYKNAYITRCYILVILREKPKTEQLIQMFHQCWHKKFLNIVAIFADATDVGVFTYNPFWAEEQFLQNFTYVRFAKDIFYDKTKDLNGSPLRILILKDDDVTKIRKEVNNVTGEIIYKGKDIELLQNIIIKLNASVEILNSAHFLKPGERNPWRETNDLNANMIPIKKRIITEQRVDLLNAAELILNKDMIGITESLYPHGIDDLYIVVQKSDKIPYYLYLFMVLKFELWCTCIFIFLIVVVFGFYMVHCVKFCFWRIESLTVIRVALNVSIPKLPAVNSERIFLIFWMLYSFIVAIAFQSKLTSMLMEPKYYPDINTLEELDNSGLNIQAYRTIIHEIDRALNNSSKHGIVKKMVAMPDSFDHAENSKNNFYLALQQPMVINYYRAIYIARQRIFYKHGRPILHLVKESPLPRYLAFQVADGSPYLHVVNKLVRRFQETGFFIIWNNLAEHSDVIKHILVPADYSFKDATVNNSKLTIFHLQTAFLNLFTGILISFVVFIVEIVKNR